MPWPSVFAGAFTHTFNTAEDWGALGTYIEGYGGIFEFCSPTHITAWDPVLQRRVWRVEHDSQVPGGLLATAGDLVFQGLGNGFFSAYDATDGRRLWRFRTGVGIMAPAISYSVDGEQYIAVVAGVGGSHGVHRDRLAGANDGRILAFRLGGKAVNPAPASLPEKPIHVPNIAQSDAEISHGRALYGRHCARCHGLATRGSGVLPDLKRASRGVHESWNAIVLDGILAGGGMAGFADVLDESGAGAIHAYVVSRAIHQPDPLEQLATWLAKYVCIPASWAAD